MDVFLSILFIIATIITISSGIIPKHLNNLKAGYPYKYMKEYKRDKCITGILVIIFILCLLISLFGFSQRNNFRESANEYVPNIIKLNQYKKHCHQYKLKIRQAHQNLKHIPFSNFHNPKLSNMHLSTYNYYLNLRRIDKRKVHEIVRKYHNYQINSDQGNHSEIKRLINNGKNSIFIKDTKLRKTKIHGINKKLNKIHYNKYDIKE